MRLDCGCMVIDGRCLRDRRCWIIPSILQMISINTVSLFWRKNCRLNCVSWD